MKLEPFSEKWPAKEEDIAKLEAQLSASLPGDYRTFLLETNGGRLARDHRFDIPCGIEGSGSDLSCFYGISLPKRSNVNAVWFALEYSGLLCEKGYLPIGCDSFGNQVVLSLRKSLLRRHRRGQILFWDHEIEGLRDSLTPLAKSFDDFVEHVLIYEEYRDADENAEYAEILRADDRQRLEALLDSGVSPEAFVTPGISLLNRAMSNKAEACLQLLCQRGADASHALYRAIACGKDEIAALLVRNRWGCQPDRPGPKDDWLQEAARAEMIKTVKALLDGGYPVNRFDGAGWSVLARCRHLVGTEVHDLLVKHGAEERYREPEEDADT